MKQFVKITLAVMLGILIMGVLSIFLFFGFVGSLAALGESAPVMPREAVLTLDMSKITLSQQTKETDLFTSFQENTPSPLGIWDAMQAINAAALDPAIKFIYMRPDFVSGGIAEIEELRTALSKFRNSGKPVISYIENPTNAGYYLASVSDKIYMSPFDGGLNSMIGLSSRMYFLKDILDKLGVNVQLIRHGKYKSAGEMFVRSESSPENRFQNQEMIDAIWENWSETIAASRNISEESFNGMIDGLKLNFPTDWLEAGLVDGLMTREELDEQLCIFYQAEKIEDVAAISLKDYKTIKVHPNLKAKDRIAIIYADGEIMDGENKMGGVYGDRFAAIISDVRKDSTIKAVVFRVSSPGGSVLASEKIKSEIDLTKEVKPVIASYGNYAASGGYWISSNCNYIFSNPGTLTGSIGVFSMIPDFSGTLDKIVHVNSLSINSNDHSDMYSLMRPLDEKERAYMQASVEKIYGRFTEIVSEGRGLDVNYVDSIAQGRVWAGSDALEIGLVDKLGTIEDALAYAANAAVPGSDISSWQIVEYPKPLTTMEMLMMTLNSAKASVYAGTPFELVEKTFRSIDFKNGGKVWARIPYEIEIR